MKIRKATKKDYKEITKLRVEFEKYQDKLWKGKDRKLNNVFEKTKANFLQLLEKEVLRHLKSKDSAYFVAEVDAEMIGFLSLSIKKSSHILHLERFGRLHYAFIKKQYRGKGIFTQLMKEAKKWFKKRGINYWTLSVSAKNEKIHNLYKKLGFIDKETEMIGKLK